jgi:anti-sigma28 factor (negative regulator of flagellin synthesis)
MTTESNIPESETVLNEFYERTNSVSVEDKIEALKKEIRVGDQHGSYKTGDGLTIHNILGLLEIEFLKNKRILNSN